MSVFIVGEAAARSGGREGGLKSQLTCIIDDYYTIKYFYPLPVVAVAHQSPDWLITGYCISFLMVVKSRLSIASNEPPDRMMPYRRRIGAH